MMGSFLTRGFVMVFGYAYPAYECFKTVEKNKPDIEQLRFWCQYWILVAALTVFERVGDTFVSWVPMYSEAKLAFFIYLWYPKTKGTAYVYDSFFRPFVAKHETEIDRNILELRTRAGDIAIQYWHRAATYSQTRVFEILQYVASQSTSRPRPAPAPAPSQTQGAGARQPPPAVPPPAVRTRQPAAAPQPSQTSRSSSVPSTQQEQVPSRTSSTGSTQQRVPPSRTSSAPLSTGTTQQQQEPVQERNPPASPARVAVVQSEAVKSVAKLISQSSESEAEAMQIEAESSSANESANPPPQETVMEEVIRVTRGRLRKNRAVTTR